MVILISVKGLTPSTALSSKLEQFLTPHLDHLLSLQQTPHLVLLPLVIFTTNTPPCVITTCYLCNKHPTLCYYHLLSLQQTPHLVLLPLVIFATNTPPCVITTCYLCNKHATLCYYHLLSLQQTPHLVLLPLIIFAASLEVTW